MECKLLRTAIDKKIKQEFVPLLRIKGLKEAIRTLVGISMSNWIFGDFNSVNMAHSFTLK